MRFQRLTPYAILLVVLGGLGVLFPFLLSAVVAIAAIFVAGVAVVTGDHVVEQLRRTTAP